MKAFLRPQASLRPYATLEGENSAIDRPRSLTDLSPAVEAPNNERLFAHQVFLPMFFTQFLFFGFF